MLSQSKIQKTVQKMGKLEKLELTYFFDSFFYYFDSFNI
jgi:hypothetical protein